MKKEIAVITMVAVILMGYSVYTKNEKKIEIIKMSKEKSFGKVQGDLISIYQNKKYGYIDKKGKEILKPEWTKVKYFENFGYIVAQNEKSINIFDETGKKILEKENHKEIIPLDKNRFLTITKKNRMGLEDDRKILLPNEYIYINNLGDNQYLIAILENKNDVKSGLIEIDEKGMTRNILPVSYQGITKIDKDKFFIREADNLKFTNNIYTNIPSFIKIEGTPTYYDSEKIVSELNGIKTLYFFTSTKKASYEYIGSFLESMAIIKDDGKYGLIDNKGNIIFDTDYEFLGIASFDRIIFRENGKYGYMDKKGKIIIPAIYDEVTSFYKDRAMVVIGDEIKVINKNGEIIKNADYKVITEIKDNVIIGGVENGFGATDSNGKEIIRPEYEDMTFWGSRYIKATKDGEIYIFDYKGNILLNLSPNEKNEIYKFYYNQINGKDKIYLFKD